MHVTANNRTGVVQDLFDGVSNRNNLQKCYIQSRKEYRLMRKPFKCHEFSNGIVLSLDKHMLVFQDKADKINLSI